MKTPPLLLGFTLLFWGWQIGFTAVGALLGLILEASRVVKARWDFSDEELKRIWTFCNLALLAVLVFAFSNNDGPATLSGLAADGSPYAQRNAINASAQTATSVIRWTPAIFYLFLVAQTYSTRSEIPLSVISILLWRRIKRAAKLGERLPVDRKINPGYSFFGMCLLASSFHSNDSNEFPGYFWGACILIAWALWPHRSRRFSVGAWAVVLAVGIALGFSGQQGLNQLQQFISSRGIQLLAQLFMQHGVDPYQNKTDMGHVGGMNMSGKIVIRLETKPGQAPPDLLREASFVNYRSMPSSWYAGYSRTNNLEDVTIEANGTTWILLPNKINTTSINIACYLPGRESVLPLPTGTVRLENLNASWVKTNNVGTVIASGLGLAIFDASYAPGITIDSQPATNDWIVNQREMFGIEAVIPELHVNVGDSRDEKMRKVRAFFQDKFQYSLWQGPQEINRTNETVLSHFLLKTRSGHCEYFATATVLLLRKLEIPARYAIGYAVHEEAGANKYVVRSRDGHAWCLVWNDSKKIWEDFDTTPASFMAEEEKRASKLEFLSDAWSWVRFQISKFRWGHGHIRKYILWGLIPVLVILLYQIIFRRSWRRRAGKLGGKNDRTDWPGLDSEFYRLERRLTEFIGPRRPDETLSDWLERAAAEPALAETRALLTSILWLHYRHRFDPEGLSSAERAKLKQTVDDCLRTTAGLKSIPTS